MVDRIGQNQLIHQHVFFKSNVLRILHFLVKYWSIQHLEFDLIFRFVFSIQIPVTLISCFMFFLFFYKISKYDKVENFCCKKVILQNSYPF